MSPRGKKSVSGEISYEKAFAEMQGIVEQLEGGTTTLEEAMALYERGQELAKICTEMLNRAELRIRELTVKSTVLDSTEGKDSE